MKNNQKIFIGIMIGLLIILIIISCFVGDKKESTENNSNETAAQEIIANAQKEKDSIKEEEKKELLEIKVDEYLELYKESDKQIVLIARPTCSYCQIAEPIIQNIAYENNLDIKYLNTDNFSENDGKNLIESNEYFTEGFGTPTLLVVGEEKIIDVVDGLTDKAHYEEFFEKNGFIN